MPLPRRRKKASRSVPLPERFWIQVRKMASCWIWIGSPGNGENTHQRLLVDGKYVFAHRYAYELLVGPIPDGMQVLHRCDTPRCVNPTHLMLGTHADNMRDMRDKGRANRPVGERNPACKLTEEQVLEIRKCYKKTSTGSELARRFGVSRGHINNIAAGRCWKK